MNENPVSYTFFSLLWLYSLGCIPADEMKFVLMHLPGKVTYKEIDEMIHTVDKNGDGKISFSEFRVMMGGIPLLIPNS